MNVQYLSPEELDIYFARTDVLLARMRAMKTDPAHQRLADTITIAAEVAGEPSLVPDVLKRPCRRANREPVQKHS